MLEEAGEKMEPLKRTWAEISLDAIEHNYKVIRAAADPKTMICCVIKADAYGHGAVMLAHEYESLGADWFAVSNLEEALQLRRNGIEKPILILGYTPAQMACDLAANRISQSVFSLEYARELSDIAAKSGVDVNIHIKVDTGMTRIGFLYQDPQRDRGAIEEMIAAAALPHLNPQGIFTHFASADEGDCGEGYTRRQFACFTDAIAHLKEAGIEFEIRHCANSAAIFEYPEFDLDMVRPGIVLYGLYPSDQIRNKADLWPAMELKSVVSMTKEVDAGVFVSYGRTYQTAGKTKIATVPIGYADGFCRVNSGKAQMLVHGKRVPVIGRVCMDQLMLDVTGIGEIRSGDIVTVFGRDGGEEISAAQLASLSGTINYELVCLVGKRVPRIYEKDGKTVGSLNYINP